MFSTPSGLTRMLMGKKLEPPTTLPMSSKPKAAVKQAVAAKVPEDRIPTKLDELGQERNRCYDLSLNTAAELGIPIVGSASAGYSRRVVILERSAYKGIKREGTTYKYGWAVRIDVLVTNKQGVIKTNLPWLAASAELGLMEADWGLEVVGLTGTKIREAMSPPKELTVETYVEAKQSLDAIVAAIKDRSTKFIPELVGIVKSTDVQEREYVVGAARAYALGRLEKRRTLNQALADVRSPRSLVNDTIRAAYEEFAEITNPAEKPSERVRQRARELLGRLK